MRLFIPTILLAAAIGLFVLWTNPTYQSSKALAAQVSAYDDALTKSQELKGVRDQLLSKRNTFAAADVQKLQQVLPDNVDNIRFLIDINNIAARHGLSLKNVLLGTLTNTSQQQAAPSISTTGGPVGSVDIGFSVSASYDDMLAFLQDVEHSVRITDIQKLSFVTSSTGTTDYTFNVRTYWLH